MTFLVFFLPCLPTLESLGPNPVAWLPSESICARRHHAAWEEYMAAGACAREAEKLLDKTRDTYGGTYADINEGRIRDYRICAARAEQDALGVQNFWWDAWYTQQQITL